MQKPPTPPRPSDRRQHERFEGLFAAVRLTHGDETLILKIRNLSIGGLAIAADGQDLSWLSLHGVHDVVVFDARDESTREVKAPARMVRRDQGGVAFQWEWPTQQFVRDLTSMLEALRAPR